MLNQVSFMILRTAIFLTWRRTTPPENIPSITRQDADRHNYIPGLMNGFKALVRVHCW